MTIKNCEHCGTGFEVRPKTGQPKKYCSMKCKKIASRIRKNPPVVLSPIECLHCRTIFMPTSRSGSPQKFCSTKCRKTFGIEKARAEGKCCMCRTNPAREGKKTCEICVLKKEASRLERQGGPKVGTTIDCALCGTPFVKKRSRSIYCSEGCARKVENDARRRKYDVKDCVHCGNSFQPRNSFQIYCEALECRKAKWKSNLVSRPVKSCVACGKEFQPMRVDHNYCSRKCRPSSSVSYKITPLPPPQPCKECGEEFQPRNRSIFYCSDSCREKSHYRRYPLKLERKICKGCGCSYQPRVRGQSFCSTACRKGKKLSYHDENAPLSFGSVLFTERQIEEANDHWTWIQNTNGWRKMHADTIESLEKPSVKPTMRELNRAGVHLHQQIRQWLGVRKGGDDDMFRKLR